MNGTVVIHANKENEITVKTKRMGSRIVRQNSLQHALFSLKRKTEWKEEQNKQNKRKRMEVEDRTYARQQRIDN